MIVKNAEADLRPCLSSACELVDQIVICDTGSTDGTIAVAHEFGATVIAYPWTDHYADARNAALAPMTTDWVLVLDADEELPQATRHGIFQLLKNSNGVAGYTVIFRNYFKDRFTGMLGSLSREADRRTGRATGATSYAEHSNCRIFRRDPRVFFTGRIHEGVESQILAAGLKYQSSGLDILHFGYLAKEEDSWVEKQNRYYRITKLALEEAPENTHLLLQMGMSELHVRKDPDAALQHFEQATKIDPHCYDAWRSIGVIHKARRAYVPAIKAYSQLPVERDFGLTRAKALGEIGEAMGALSEARALYLEALNLATAHRSVGLEAEIEQRLTCIEDRMRVKGSVHRETTST
jgi:tetratricopeptide (TPR) repeat protein